MIVEAAVDPLRHLLMLLVFLIGDRFQEGSTREIRRTPQAGHYHPFGPDIEGAGVHNQGKKCPENAARGCLA